MSEDKFEEGILPANIQPLYSGEQIQAQVRRLGVEIDSWATEVWKTSHTDILAIPILCGGIFFFADLVRSIAHSVEIAPARTWAYEKGQFMQRSRVQVNIKDVPAKGRAVLVVDDICDTGKTMHAMQEALLEAGAQAVKSAVLLRRDIKGQAYTPDWVGFDYSGPEWLVGYGLDDSHRWRNLPGIYIIKQPGKK